MAALISFCRIWVVVVFAMQVGCGRSDPYATVPVKGVVTCNGKPLANGVINFTPVADQEGRGEGNRGRAALGKTDEEGRFVLTTYKNNDGAIVGRHMVTISMGFSEEGGSIVDKNFPCRGSTMEATVKAGMGEIKIDFGTKK